MAEIDSLDIKISASAGKAEQAINSLVEKLNVLSTSIGKIDGSRLSGLSNGVQKLGNAVKTLNGVKSADYTKIANGIKKFAEIDTSKLGQASSALRNLSSGLSAIGNVQNLQNVTPAINALKNLAKVDMRGLDTGKLGQMASVLTTLGTSMSGVGKIDSNITRLVGAMARLASSGQYIGNVTSEFPKIGNSVVKFAKDIQKVGSVDANVAKLVDGIARLASAGKRTKETTQHLKSLGDAVMNFLNRLKHAPAINTNIANVIQGLGNLAASGSKVLLSSNNLSSGTSRLGNSLKSLTGRISNASIGINGLVKSFGTLYLKIQLLRRAARWFGKSIKLSMDYIEDLNYFNAAFGQVAEKADLKSFKKMGYESAEAYYNSFSERAEQITQKMSGFKVDKNGMALSTGEKSMGIDPSLVMNYQAMFAQMSSSMGTASEMSMKLSETFTKLGADIASVRNMDFKKVWEDMASGMVGMSRTVDKYGANIRNVNLQQQLSNLGIDKSIVKLNQQEKALLRTIVILDSTRYAWGDMARTIEQPANQLRLLQSNFSNLGRTIGNIFLPMVAKVLPYLNAITIVLQRFAEQIVKLLGFKDFDWGGLGATGGSNLDLGNLPDDSEDVADNMDKTAKKAKKAVDNLQGFDIINKLQDPNSDNDSGKDKDKGLSGTEMAKLTGALEKLMDEYNKVWENAFKDMENKANELANKMQKALVNAWNKGDFSEIGKKAAAWINRGLAKIPWESIKKTVKKTARSIATFLNGFIAGLDWKLIGKTFAEGLNTIIEGGYEFWTTFDWLTFGTSLATGVNSFIDNFDAKKFGKLLGAKLRGVIQFAFGFITNLNFEELGEKIGNAINGFFEDMGEVRKNTGLTGWKELGQTISKSITGILDTINTALSTVKWEEVGKSLADFLINIDWWGILGKLLTVLGNTLSVLVKTAISAIAENPAGVIKSLTGAFALIFTVKKLMSGMGFLTNTFKSLIGSGITSGINKIPNSSIKSGIASKFGNLGSIIVSLEVLATSVSFAQSEWKDVFDKYDTTEIYKAGKEMEKAGNVLGEAAVGWGAILGGGFSFEEWGNGIKEWWEDQWSKDTDVKNIDQSVEEVKKRISEFGKRYNPVTGKTTRDSEEYKKEKKEYLKNLEKEKPELYKKYMEYEKQEKVLNESTKKLSATFKSFGNDTKTASSRINSLKEEVRRGNISLSAYKKLISGTYKSNKNWTEALRDARLATKYTNGDIDKFNEKGRTLSKTLEKSGVETGKAKNAVSLLKDKLNEGKISFSDYEKICSKSYETTGDLYSTLDKIKGLGKISPEIRAKIEGKQEVDDLGNEIKTIKDKNVTITANAETTDAKYKINDLITGKKVTITASLGNTKELTEKIKNALKATPFKMTAAQIFPNKEQIAEYFKKITESKAWKNVMTFTPTPGKQVQVDDKNKSVKIPKDADFGGVLSRPYAAMGYKINYYAVGGFPNQGQLFVANEKGAELVGNMNGRTTVAPQNDIAEGFAQAITNTLAPVMYSAFKQAATETAQIRGGDVYLDGMKVTGNIIGHINQISQSRGRSPIWGVN